MLLVLKLEQTERRNSCINGLISQSIYNETDELNNQGVKLATIGDVEILPKSCQKALIEAKEKTKNNKKITINFST